MKIEIISIIFFIGLNFSAVLSQDSLNVQDTEINKLKERVTNLEGDMNVHKISRDFFNSIINSQTAIFSLIVVILLGSNFLFSRKDITSRVAQEFLNLKTDIESWEESSFKSIENKISSKNEEIDRKLSSRDGEIDKKLSSRDDQIKNQVAWLTASNYRALAVGHQDNPKVAQIWWLRSAIKFNSIGNDLMVRNTLNLLEVSLSAIQESDFRTESQIEEYKELFDDIDNAIYSDELKSIEVQIKRIDEGTESE